MKLVFRERVEWAGREGRGREGGQAPEPEQSNHLQGVASLSAESWYRQVLFSSANTNPKGWCSVPTNPGWTWSFKNLSILKVEIYF